MRNQSTLRIALTALVALLWGSALTPDAYAQSVQRQPVRGIVFDSQTRQPIPEVRIRIARVERSAITDANGRFETEPLAPGAYVVSIDHPGYEPVKEMWEIGAEEVFFEIDLDPDPLRLEAITVTARRLDSRSRAGGESARVFDRKQLGLSVATDLQQWIAPRINAVPVSCRMLTPTGGDTDCFRIRGTPTQVLVCVDESRALGGMNDLALYRPSEIDRVEIYGGGREIRLYTTWFMGQMAKKRNFRPSPRLPGGC